VPTLDAKPAAAPGPAADADAVFAAIRDFLASTSTSVRAQDVTVDTPVLEGGALDSLGILQLMMLLSDKMQIEVTDEDFVPENFKTVGSLVRFVMAKRCPTP
jgi:acyl carrier protein